MKPCLALDDLWPRLAQLAPPAILADVDGRSDRRPRPTHVGRIVLAQELTVGTEAAGRLAAALARRTDAILDVVAVVDAFSEVFQRRNPAAIRDPDRFLATMQALLDVQVLLNQQRGIRCVGHLLVGAPPLELARHATATRTDLMVLAWSPRTVAHLARALHWRALPVDLAVERAGRC